MNLPKQLTVALIINQFQEHMVDSKPELARYERERGREREREGEGDHCCLPVAVAS